MIFELLFFHVIIFSASKNKILQHKNKTRSLLYLHFKITGRNKRNINFLKVLISKAKQNIDEKMVCYVHKR
jgi:hypothetical protein